MRVLHWFRNDLRLRDNTALAAACGQADELVLVFVLDERLLASSGSPRRRFLADCLGRLARSIAERGQVLVLRRGDPVVEVPRLLGETGAGLLTFNRDTTPYARRRDAGVRAAVERAGARVLACKDRVVFESGEVRTREGGAFRVYTPFRRAWEERLRTEGCEPGRLPRLPAPVARVASEKLPDAEALAARDDAARLPTAGEDAAQRRLSRFVDGPIADYARQRDLPALDGTSRLSPYLRFGALSPRQCVAMAREVAAREPRAASGARKWLEELVWREFYAGILEEHPRVLRRAFRPEFEAVRWDRDPARFQAWCEGRTGYPFVDAGMRQLAEQGWVHNRVRMVVASFLVKDLLLDWRLGERFFLGRLVDGDPASNNGGWQWSASTGTDAQPWFRIFNPVAQGERFDPEGRYVRRYLPELREVPDRFVHQPWRAPQPPAAYPRPCVDHARQRRLVLARFEQARSRGG